jgi:hypothetical protein
METREIPYTEKFPIMYQAILTGYIIQTTDQEKFRKLVSYLADNCTGDNYYSIPAAKRLQIECAFDVRRTL